MTGTEDGRLKRRQCPHCTREIRGPSFYRHVKAHGRGTAVTAVGVAARADRKTDRMLARVVIEAPTCDRHGETHVCSDGKIVFAIKETV